MSGYTFENSSMLKGLLIIENKSKKDLNHIILKKIVKNNIEMNSSWDIIKIKVKVIKSITIYDHHI